MLFIKLRFNASMRIIKVHVDISTLQDFWITIAVIVECNFEEWESHKEELGQALLSVQRKWFPHGKIVSRLIRPPKMFVGTVTIAGVIDFGR
jgi:hypothetical protein